MNIVTAPLRWFGGLLQDRRMASVIVIPAVLATGGWLIATPLSTWALILLLVSMALVYGSNTSLWVKLGLAAVMLIGIIPWAGKANLSLTFLFISVFINVALALGLNLVVGFAGLLDLGYIAFFAGGAYIYAIFGSGQGKLLLPSLAHIFPFGGWWFWVCLPIAVGFAAFLGLALGIPVLRLKGDYLAIVTLGFGEIINLLALNLNKPINVTNGPLGISNIVAPSLFGWHLSKEIHFYFIGMVIMVITIFIMLRLERSRIGRAWAAMREDETAARAMGINLTRMKLMAFATGASFAGAMGMLFAMKQQFIDPNTFTFLESVGILAMVILGGLGSIPGVITGAVALTVIRLQILKMASNWVHRFDLPNAIDLVKYQPMMFGLILILMMLYRQQGLIPNRPKPADIAAIEAAPDPLAVPAGRPGAGLSS